jgi:DNA polymerase III alpha subunit
VITIVGLNNTELNDRILWYDGDSTVGETDIYRLISTGVDVDGVFVKEITDSIKQYNRLVPPKDQITTKVSIQPLSYEWNLPEEYLNLDIMKYVAGKLETTSTYMTVPAHEWYLRVERVVHEYEIFVKMGLVPILRAVIYIINTLEEKNVVWGVGRGSSVSSYLLYVIGVHDVDSFAYDLDIHDFLRTS